MLACPLISVQAAEYSQEAGINYSSSTTSSSTNNSTGSNDHSAAISADFTFNFAPTFVSGPVTQHAYVQKISQFTLKSNHNLSDNGDSSNFNSNELSLSLFPPGHSFYLDLALSSDAVTPSDGTVEKLNRVQGSFALFTSGKLSFGLQTTEANNSNYAIENLYRYAGNTRGLFVKNVIRAASNYYFMFEATLHGGSYDISDNEIRKFRDGRLLMALYPDRQQEWAMDYQQFRIDASASQSEQRADTRILSYTNFFNKNNGLVLKAQFDRSPGDDQRQLALGWKFRL